MRSQIARAARWAVQTKESVLKKASGNSYATARAYYRQKLERSARRFRGAPLLVYQMGKVGSKTVIQSLRALQRAHALDMPVYHVHFLNQPQIDEFLDKRKGFLGTEKQGRLEHLWLYEYLREQLDAAQAREEQNTATGHAGYADIPKWKVVTLTRESVGRNVSSFFELVEVEPLDLGGESPDSALARYRVRSDPDFYGFDVVVDTGNLHNLTELFLQEPDHDEPAQFFDKEILGVLGVDVYEADFPTSKGWAIYEGKFADVLLIRVEDLNECAGEAFKEFLGVPELPLINENVGSEKAYASLYKAFRQTVVLPESYLDRMYASKYMHHFYSADEIAAFKRKWLRA